MLRKFIVVAGLFTVILIAQAIAATTLLPNAKQCFTITNGVPAVSGSLNMFVVGTTTPKATWQDANQNTLNTQPIQLDAQGCAIIYGTGSYRQQLYSGPVVAGAVSGLEIWDQITTDTSATNNVFWAGTAGGTPNAITVTDAGFNSTDGSIIQFIPISNNTGATTLTPSGTGTPVPIVKDSNSGPVALTGGEIVAGNIISVVYSASGSEFHLSVVPPAAASSTAFPLCGATNLLIVNDSGSPSSKVDITADQVTMVSTTGAFISRTSVSVSVNLSNSGANGLDTGTVAASTWYNIFVTDNGTAPAGLGSLSATGPTLPGGYVYKCRLGAVSTDGSVNLYRTRQRGKSAQYVVTASTNTSVIPVLASGTAGTASATSPVLAAVTVAGNGQAVPPTANKISIAGTNVWKSNAPVIVQVAPNTGWGGTNNGPIGSNGLVWPMYLDNLTNNLISAQVILVLESTAIAWASGGSTGAIACLGWEDSVNAN